MFNLATTLIGGIIVILTLFLLIHRFTRLNGKAVAMWMALLVIGTVIPYSILFWPGADVFAIHFAVYLMTVYILGIITSQRESAVNRSWHWGPYVIGGFFLVVISVDSVLVTLAQKGMDSNIAKIWLPKPDSGVKVSSFFPGTVSHDFQQKGQQYNAYLDQVAEQHKLGWQVSKGWLHAPVANKDTGFKVRILDSNKKPVAGANVVAQFLRPSDKRQDRIYMLTETAAGDYQNDVNLPLPGRWSVVLKIEQAENRFDVRAATTINAK